MATPWPKGFVGQGLPSYEAAGIPIWMWVNRVMHGAIAEAIFYPARNCCPLLACDTSKQ